MATADPVPVRTPAAMPGIAVHDLVTRKTLRLDRDPARVIVKLFAPGTRPVGLGDRAGRVIEQVLALDDAEVEAAYRRVLDGFGSRHRDLEGVFAEHFNAMAHRVTPEAELTDRRRLLIGALFTHEVAIEGAALTNPSMVPHPDQSGLRDGELRFVMSARAIGEGHVSCVEFRTGVVSTADEIHLDRASRYATCGSVQPTTYDLSALQAAIDRPADDDEVLACLLTDLPKQFSGADLELALSRLHPQLLILEQTQQTIADVHWFLARQYATAFEDTEDTSERVLWPMSSTERHGIEDARFVRFTDADGTADYRATYTAWDGNTSRTQLIRTADFRSFRMSQLFGEAVGDKGLALFPRLVGGRHLAMSRWDTENNAIAFSDDGVVWPRATGLTVPPRIWRLMQVGNCGSPIETEAGWLVLTHGVGPMRVYSLGVLLLDLDDPTRVIAALPEPLLTAAPDEREGYVPNVVYSCGALKCGDRLVIPYGFGDMGIEFATASIPDLLDQLRAG